MYLSLYPEAYACYSRMASFFGTVAEARYQAVYKKTGEWISSHPDDPNARLMHWAAC